MVTVPREGGLRLVVYRDDHEPPHVHVFGDGETKIELGTTPSGSRVIFRCTRASPNDVAPNVRSVLTMPISSSGGPHSMDEISDAEWQAAEARGRIELATRPRASAARYDRVTKRLTIDLVNGSTFVFDPRLIQGLEHASDDEIAEVEPLGAGFGLHWETADTDAMVEGLLAGRFGSRRYMIERFGSAWGDEAAA